MKHRLLKPYVETFLAFELNQLREKPTRSTLHNMSLIDHILTIQRKKLGIMVSFLLEYPTMTLFTVPGKQKLL